MVSQSAPLTLWSLHSATRNLPQYYIIRPQRNDKQSNHFSLHCPPENPTSVVRKLEAPRQLEALEDEAKLASADNGAGSGSVAEEPAKAEADPTAGASSVVRLPDKIMTILLNEEAPDAIWWLKKGTAFAMQKEKFQEQILDKHFRGNKFKSLVRNLHRWYGNVMLCYHSMQYTC